MRTLRTWIGTVASLSSYGYVLLGLCAFGGEHYTVQGRLRFEILSKHAVDDYTFTVAVSNHLWGIEVRPVKKSDVSRVLQVYDGKHVTCATYPSKREATEGFLTVEESEIPSLEAAGYSEQLWLAYASRYYFDQVKGDRLKPITYQPIERRSSGFTTPAKWERSDEGVGLPQSVLYYYDLHLSLKQSNTNAQRSTSEGIVWAAYNASEFTNVSGVSVPLAFSFTAYE